MIGEDKEGRLEKIPVGRIRAPERPLRREATPEEVRPLAASLRKHGLLQPIVVRPSGRYYEIVCGLRRFLAWKSLGKGDIAAIVRHLDDRQAFELALAENARREGLTAAEREEALRRLLQAFPGRAREELEEWLGPGEAETAVFGESITSPFETIVTPPPPPIGEMLPEWIDQIPETDAPEEIVATGGSPDSPTVVMEPPGGDPGEAPTVPADPAEEAGEPFVAERTFMRRRRMLPYLRVLLRTLNKNGRLDYELLQGIVDEILEMFVRMPLLEFLDLRYHERPQRYLPRHCLNVAKLSVFMARELKFSPDETRELVMAALLHDAGMMRVKDPIYAKQAGLTEEEWGQVKTHPLKGGHLLLMDPRLPRVVARVAQEHHERPDGTGYPAGKKRDEIHLYARLIKVLDTYEAMVSPRVKRLPLLPFNAMQAVMEEGASGLLDWDLVYAFVRAFSVYPLGSYLKLETGEIGRVVRAHPEAPEKPVIALVADAKRNVMKEPVEIDLAVPGTRPALEPIPAPM